MLIREEVDLEKRGRGMKVAERAEVEALREVRISEGIPESHVSNTFRFMERVTTGMLPPDSRGNDFYSHLFRSILHVQRLEPRRLTCLFSVVPPIVNYFGGLHGGAVAAIAELVSIACARTVVAEDKELFLGELSLSYLSAAPPKAEVVVDASVVRSGRNLTVVAVEFKMKKDNKLVYTARATFYNMPLSKL